MDSDNALGQPVIKWLDPWNYPTRVSDRIALTVAEAIARGADFRTAVMSAGVAPSRARQWLLWGEEAYRKDADGNDPHADYLNFFLKIMQAIGLAGVPAQQQTLLEAPGWWLSHNPEHRGGWGAANLATAEVTITDTTEVEASSANAVLQPPSPEDVRTIIRTIVEAGTGLESESSSGSDVPNNSVDSRQLDAG